MRVLKIIVVMAFALSRSANADTTDDAVNTLEKAMLCGVDYVGSTLNASVAGAEIACSGLLDKYTTAMRTLGIRAALGNGKSPEEARIYATKLAMQTREKARSAFEQRAQQIITQGKAPPP